MIDTHCHIYFPHYDHDRNAVIERAAGAGVSGILMPYVDSSTYAALAQCAERYACCRMMMGLHPTAVKDDWRRELDFSMQHLESAPKGAYAAIGEIGLDAHWTTDFMDEQKQVFAAMLAAAARYDLPVNIHCRDAFDDCIDAISKAPQPLSGVFHAFGGSVDDYKRIKALGDFSVGIGGVVTFKNSAIAHALPSIPLCDIVLETDAPYLAPAPLRGTRNESACLTHIVERIAAIKDIPADAVRSQTSLNAKRIFYRSN